ncbi:MAG: hypothetical protein MUF22_02330 [Chitinispirillaceae bacterium]|jgi:hypothetical protein|nr:hypothetical protein [Chitinispirillaceae bacterium]
MQQRGRYFLFANLCLLLAASGAFAQYVPFYPIEIYFSPLGTTNNLPGANPDRYALFSAAKIILEKDLPAPEKFANSLSFIGNIEHYNGSTEARTYFPLMANPVLRSHYFMTDIVTFGTEINGTYEQYPDVSRKNTAAYDNYKLRLRPFLYVIPTPASIVKLMATIGASRNSDNAGKDYDLFKYELTTILLGKFNTRYFLVPYAYTDQYYNLPARSSGGIVNLQNPNLTERGFGITAGARHGSFKYGYSEAAVEYEHNSDLVFGANNYHKLKLTTRWENQYFTERYGFLIMADYVHYESSNDIYSFPDPSRANEPLAQDEIIGDVMFILNLNRNVSLRPEYIIINKSFSNSYNYNKHRYALNLHVWW